VPVWAEPPKKEATSAGRPQNAMADVVVGQSFGEEEGVGRGEGGGDALSQ
jgi:hypothetical protein